MTYKIKSFKPGKTRYLKINSKYQNIPINNNKWLKTYSINS